MNASPPRTPDEMNAALDALVLANYYSEDYESDRAARELLAGVAAADRGTFEAVFLQRLAADPSIANLFLAGSFGFESAVPEVVAALDRCEDANNMTRTILYVLSQLGDGGYAAMERFVDSELEIEALTWLARMDFDRTIPHLRRALHNDGLLKTCLHIFAAYRSQHDIEALVGKLVEIRQDDAELGRRLALAVSLQDDPYNPLDETERQHALAVLV